MTDKQRISLQADWWPKACKVQGWQASDRDLRLRVLSVAVSYTGFGSVLDILAAVNSTEALPRQLQSANELNEYEDIDAVKRVLGLLADNLEATKEVSQPGEGPARRFRIRIQDYMRCMALYPLSKPMGAEGAAAYVAELIRDMFNKGSRVTLVTLDDLGHEPTFYYRKGSQDRHEGPSELERLTMRLATMVNGKKGLRATAKHSVHEMSKLAAVRCPGSCSICFPRKPMTLAVPVAEAETEDRPF